MRALITGATGFVGAHLAEHLLAAGDDVVGCSARGAWHADAPGELASRVPLFAWDLAVEPAPAELVDFAPECIYHLAAVSVPEDCGDEQPTPEAWMLNVEGARGTMNWALALPRPPRVILASTSHVYAPVDAAHDVVGEASRVQPTSAYGRTKQAAEQAAAEAFAAGLDVIAVRFFAHTGPRQPPRLMLPEWAEQLARGGDEPLHVHTLDATLDLADVRDGVRAYRLLAEHGARGSTYNLGSGIRRRSGDVLAELQRVAGTSRRVVETRPGVKRGPIADLARLHAATGWRGEIPWEQTLRDTLEYWRRRVPGAVGPGPPAPR